MLDLLLNFSTLYHEAERYLHVAEIVLAFWIGFNAAFIAFMVTHWHFDGRPRR